MNVKIRLLQERDVEPIANAFQSIGWNKLPSQYQRYLLEQQEGGRTVLVAFIDEQFAGYLTIVWSSDYRPFRAEGIPEIQDFNVLSKVRRMGIGTQLMQKAEEVIARRSPIAGIGVGMTADYGAAQRLYVLRGYTPDGKGLTLRNEPVENGQQITVDDGLVLHLVKTLAA